MIDSLMCGPEGRLQPCCCEPYQLVQSFWKAIATMYQEP